MSTRRFTHVTPPPVRVLAAMGAVLVLLLALVVTAGRAGAAPTAVSSGTVDWGVMAGFRGYVSGPIAQGTITTGDGATTNSDGTFRFGVGSGSLDSATSAIDLETGGSVRFLGHHGALDVQIRDVRVDVTGTTGSLIVDATSKPMSGGDAVTHDDVALATLDLTGIAPTAAAGSHTWSAIPATLTAAGVPVFTNYPAGTALDPVTFTVSFAPPGSSTTTSTSTTSTTSSTTTSTVPVGSTTTTSTVPAPGPDDGEIVGGHLDWGVKASFRSYVTSPVANGAVTVGGGATTNIDGTLRFPAESGSAEPDGASFDATFGGSVRFTGHAGELDLVITGIEVHTDGDDGVLVADVSSHQQGTSDVATFDDVVLAALDLSEVIPGSNELTVTWADIDAALTAAGAPAFGGFYAAGDELDPVTVVLEVSETTVPPGGGGSGDAATVSKSVLAPGDQLTVTGAGFTPGEQIEVWVHSDPQWVGTTVADSAGNVSYAFALPLELPAGQHHVRLIGISSGLILDTAAFTVTAGASAAGAVTPSGPLPYTGGDSLPVVAGGATLLLAGLGLAMVARRRVRAA